MSVCPFCGAISEKSEVPCPRCKMENSALTRQATRARIGPWYVMQARNPSAPGMKCNTLLALIRKGQITPRSVIRGPTTFQLWRFAARVKGISREFGLCYSCGAELQRISTFCPRCSRSQELPPNPDVLLENEPQSKTVYRQVNQRPDLPAAAPMEPPPQQARPAAASEPEQDRPPRPATQIPSAAETMAELADIPSPHSAPPEMQSRPRQRPQEGILTPRELAAAFSIQYDPTMDSSGKPRRERGGWGLAVAAVLLLMVGGGVSVFYFMPTLRARFIAFLQGSSTPSAVQPNSPPPAKSVPDGNPPWMNYVPDETPPITTVNKPSGVDSSNNSSPNSSPTSGVASNWNNSPGDPPVIAPDNHSAAPVVNPTPAPQPPPVGPVAIAQNPTPAPSNPPPANDNSTATPVPIPNDPGTAAAAETANKLKQSFGDDPDTLAMKLRNSGLDAEAKQDYNSARYFYQQVESLPPDHWPSDIDRLLKNAEKHFGDSH